jgi:hypothetical protein
MSKEISKVVELLDNYKARAAFLAPFVAGVGSVVTNWIVTGEWNDTEFKILVGGVATGIFTAVATWFAPAGNAVVEPLAGTEISEDEPMPEGDVTKFSQE